MPLHVAQHSNTKANILAIGAGNYKPRFLYFATDTDEYARGLEDETLSAWYRPEKDHIFVDFGLVTGSTLIPGQTIPATQRDWRLNLFRSGIRMTYLKDFTVSGSNLTLVVAAEAEPFTLIIIPQ